MADARSVSSKTKELSIICDDRPGMLSHLAQLLGDAEVNIVAINCAPLGVQGIVRLVVDDVPGARNAFDGKHLSYMEHDVLLVEMPNLPGTLAEFAAKLAAKNINITTAYGAAAKDTKNAIVVFRVSDLDKALSIV
ncbi:MAG: ACT domain-containing protein [Candidatus Acidiferrales bacterium]|jgi:hypothetical protein